MRWLSIPKTVNLAGFFVKVKSNGEPLDPYFAEITYGHARRLGLPVEKVKSVSRFGPQMGIFDRRDQEGYFSINHDGKNYRLYSRDAEGKTQPNFMVYDLEDWTGHFMTPDEFRFCHKLLQDDGYGHNSLRALEEDFIVAGERRKLPRPLLTEGKITCLRYDVTINGREYLMSVSCKGSASLTCMKEMQEAMRAISAGRTTMSFNRESSIRFTSADMVREKLEETRALLNKHSTEVPLMDTVDTLLTMDLEAGRQNALKWWGISDVERPVFKVKNYSA